MTSGNGGHLSVSATKLSYRVDKVSEVGAWRHSGMVLRERLFEFASSNCLGISVNNATSLNASNVIWPAANGRSSFRQLPCFDEITEFCRAICPSCCLHLSVFVDADSELTIRRNDYRRWIAAGGTQV